MSWLAWIRRNMNGSDGPAWILANGAKMGIEAAVSAIFAVGMAGTVAVAIDVLNRSLPGDLTGPSAVFFGLWVLIWKEYWNCRLSPDG